MSKKKHPPHDLMTGELLTDLSATPRSPEYFRAVSAQDLYLDPQGREILDPRPMAPPVGYTRQPTMVDIIRQQIRSHTLAAEAQAQGLESFEEADDFNVDDDFDPTSPYEEIFDPIPPQARYLNAVEELGPQGIARRKPHTAPAEPTDGDPAAGRPQTSPKAQAPQAPASATPPVAKATE